MNDTEQPVETDTPSSQIPHDAESVSSNIPPVEDQDGEGNQSSDSSSGRSSWMGYVVPMVAFTLFGLFETGDATRYVWIYILKVLVVTGALLYFREPLRDYRFEPRVIVPGVLVGMLVFAEWIWIDPHWRIVGIPVQMDMGKRVAFDPTLLSAGLFGLFVTFRLFGLAIMVPLMEELFWRSFLIRFITTERFKTIAPWQYSVSAFALVCGGFTLAHPEWLAALICAVAYGLLLKQTRSLFACLIAHAVTNLALGIYVLTTHAWRFW